MLPPFHRALPISTPEIELNAPEGGTGQHPSVLASPLTSKAPPTAVFPEQDSAMPFVSLFPSASRSVPIVQMGELRHRGINSLPQVTQVDSDSQLPIKPPASNTHPHAQPAAASSRTASSGPALLGGDLRAGVY